MKLVLRILGGLGNQLFQYGTMRYLNLKYPGSEMCIDARRYEKYKVRDFELKAFKLYDNITDYKEDPIKYTVSREAYHVYQYLYHRCKHRQAPMLGKFFVKKGLIYATVDFKMPENLDSDKTYFLYGYFGKVDYVKEIRSILIEDTRLKAQLSDQAQKYAGEISAAAEKAVGVSVRYGMDYRSLGWPICTPEYYRSGMDKIQAERGGNCKFFVFSDALDEVIKNKWFEGYDVTYVKGCNVVEGFSILRSCRDFVIANSSFSWWASWLSEDDNRIVYAPNYFFSEIYEQRYDKLMVFEQERFLDYKTGKEVENILNS